MATAINTAALPLIRAVLMATAINMARINGDWPLIWPVLMAVAINIPHINGDRH
jgi:hypothetical protein